MGRALNQGMGDEPLVTQEVCDGGPGIGPSGLVSHVCALKHKAVLLMSGKLERTNISRNKNVISR